MENLKPLVAVKDDFCMPRIRYSIRVIGIFGQSRFYFEEKENDLVYQWISTGGTFSRKTKIETTKPLVSEK